MYDYPLEIFVFNSVPSAVLNGYAAVLRGDALQHVLNSPDVEYVAQDGES